MRGGEGLWTALFGSIEDTNPTESNDRSVQQRSVKQCIGLWMAWCGESLQPFNVCVCEMRGNRTVWCVSQENTNCKLSSGASRVVGSCLVN